MNLNKFIKSYWMIFLIIAFLILFGSISFSVKTNLETFDDSIWNTCPKTQNCSAGGIVHKCDKDAMKISEKQCLQNYDTLQKKFDKIQDQLNTQESSNATLQDSILDQRNSSTSLLSKSQGLESDISHYKTLNANLMTQVSVDKKQITTLNDNSDTLNTQIQNLNKKVNTLKISLKDVQMNSCISDCKIKLASDNKLGLTVLNQAIKDNSEIILNLGDDNWTLTQQGYIVLDKNPSYGLTVLNQDIKESNPIILHQGKNKWIHDKNGYIRLHKNPDYMLAVGDYSSGSTPIIISKVRGVPWNIRKQ